MATFLQNVDDPKLAGRGQAGAMAISGWLLGPADASPKLGHRALAGPPAQAGAALSQRTGQAQPGPHLRRIALRGRGYAHDAGADDRPHEAALRAAPAGFRQTPGYYDLEVSILPEEAPVHYLLQLPPDYNPYRRYPMVITLHGAGTTASEQVDWWAGDWVRDARHGQAGRLGCIVMAPQWAGEHQEKYRYTGREHAMVLGCYRDACRRFAVDTDRVFLSGHSMGGDAAWDMGLAHPDLWAGVIPVVAEADRFCPFYCKNAKQPALLPRLRRTRRQQDGQECQRVGPLSAGGLQRHGRPIPGPRPRALLPTRSSGWSIGWAASIASSSPATFNCATMREGDNFFWWVELGGMPPRTTVNPEDWPPPRGTRPAQVAARITANNNLSIQTKTSRLTVWLAPGMFDFKRAISIVVNGRKMNNHATSLAPNLETLLEDVRTRGDRLHPFWSKFECTTGRLAE